MRRLRGKEGRDKISRQQDYYARQRPSNGSESESDSKDEDTREISKRRDNTESGNRGRDKDVTENIGRETKTRRHYRDWQYAK